MVEHVLGAAALLVQQQSQRYTPHVVAQHDQRYRPQALQKQSEWWPSSKLGGNEQPSPIELARQLPLWCGAAVVRQLEPTDNLRWSQFV